MTARPGDRVRVLYGRWAGRVGTLVRWHYNPGGMRQQAQTYPVVALDAAGRAKAREVRVLAVEPVETACGNCGESIRRGTEPGDEDDGWVHAVDGRVACDVVLVAEPGP